MFRLKPRSFFHWFRWVAILLIIGMILPTQAALARTTNGSGNQSGFHTSRTASTYWSKLAVPIQKQAGWQANVPSAGPNLIQDPSFESFVPPSSNPYWAQSDNYYGT